MRLLDGQFVERSEIVEACLNERAFLVWYGNNERGLVIGSALGGPFIDGGEVDLNHAVWVTVPSLEVALRVAMEAEEK